MWYDVGRNRGGTKDPMLSERAADGGEREPRALFPKRRYGRRGQPDRGNWGTGGVEVVSRSDYWRQRMDHPVSLLHDCTRTTPIVFTSILYSHPHISSEATPSRSCTYCPDNLPPAFS